MIASMTLAGCVAPTAPPPPAPPAPAPAPPPPAPAPPLAWRDAPLSPGTWSFAPSAAGSEARYGVAGAVPAFTMACTPARRIAFGRASAAPTGQAGNLRIVTTSGEGQYTVIANGSAQSGETAASDPLLDRMAFSRGRFLVMLDGTERLIMPAWPEVSRVIEDCR